ncbi:MAG: molybdopterin-dependent oxidoreductase [Clostridia bacterium]|nr:molybdopterin-dependent oxidoreductase [Clostridia bacterium]
MKKIIGIALTVIMLTGICVGMSGCGTDDIDISSYADSKIVLSGITDEDITITIADLKALECKTVKTESTSDKIGVVKATGPELDTLLSQYGVSKADFRKVIFEGTDQYDVKLLNDYITEHDIYLAFGIDGEPLDGESAPCRVIIPKSDSAYWIRMVDRINFEK